MFYPIPSFFNFYILQIWWQRHYHLRKHFGRWF